MKLIAVLAVMFFKWSVVGVPLWVSIFVLALVGLVVAYWYRRLKKRSETETADESAELADSHADTSDGEEDGTR
ncbi:hypothetical protein AWC05_18900 [Mycobacterium florentinum]|uniref:Uncharacterized protein n=1 Tax=Mycobacterium florentinum TaxID=292462 RepID=A0A1X1UBW0_MYCFL|nr:hypothetical protein [Mycobacterium florentinum]MCV7408212.1 hypothetical protein [Mycobacterium florentinum]ORV54159.1 hypothetical protein AWC05_18900 [Mycobacterium florentinum]BBX78620.1 hypothetical protein MFLOJ_24070 [Mycobacterium florentinum]